MDNVALETYDADKQSWVVVLYLGAMLVWTLIILYFNLHVGSAKAVLLLPYVTFTVAMLVVKDLTAEVEAGMTRAAYLPLGVILLFPLMNWIVRESPENKERLMAVMITALAFSLMTFIDVWLPQDKLSIYFHFRSAFQVMSVTLIIYALVTYYLQKPGTPL